MSNRGYCRQIHFFRNIPPIIFSNFNYDQLVVKTKFKGLKRQSSGKITDRWLNDVCSKWRHCPTVGMVFKNFFLQNIPLITFNNFNFDQLVVKTKFKSLIWQLVKLLKKYQMMSLNDVICPTLGKVCKNIFFRIFLLIYPTTSTMINLSWKPSLRAWNGN